MVTLVFFAGVSNVVAIEKAPDNNILTAQNAEQKKATASTAFKEFSAAATTGRILVRFKGGVSQIQTSSIVAASGTKTLKRFKSVTGLQLLQVPPSKSYAEVLSDYQNNPNVLYAEPDYVIEPHFIPDDASFPELWGLHNTGTSSSGGINDADINAPEAWEITQGSDEVVVAIIDTGVDYTHEDLLDNIWVNPNEIPGNNIDDDGNGYVDDVHGIDAVNRDSDPMDDVDHGTHVAGTIAAKGNNSIGVAGVAWHTKVLACKMLAYSPTTLKGGVSDAIACLDYIYDLKVNHNINIIATNNSWGWFGPYSNALQEAIARQADAGILFVASAGNNGSDNNFGGQYPASYYLPNLISVAATTSSDDLALFSSFGDKTVHVGAPGQQILSTVPGSTISLPQNPFNSILFNDVEGDQSQWQAQSPWTTTDRVAYSGGLSWTDSPNGQYENNSDTSLTSPTIDLSGIVTGPQYPIYLGFYAQYELETGWDYVLIEVSGDNGANWGTLGGITGANFNWSFHYYIIPNAFYTNQFKFRLRLQSDSSVTMDGISIDDIGVGVLPSGVDLSSNQYATFSGTSMAAPHVTGLLALLKAQSPGRDWKQLKNLLLTGGTPTPALQDATITGRRIRAADANGSGSLTCNNQTVTKRLLPIEDQDEISVTSAIGLSVLNITCEQPAGEVTVAIAETGAKITLRDDGNGFDQIAGDGVYSAQTYVSDYGKETITLRFPDNSEAVATAFNNYRVTETNYRWRNIRNVEQKLDITGGIMRSFEAPFTILFADKTDKYNAVGVGDSGYLILHRTDEPFTNIPTTGNQFLPFSAYHQFFGFGTLIAPFWDDLMVTGGGGIYWGVLGAKPNRELVIEWRNLTHFAFGGTVTFQAIFKENSSDIVFNYQDVLFGNAAADKGASATVGVQTTANSATAFSTFAPNLRSGQSLLWQTTGGNVSGKPDPATTGNMTATGGLSAISLCFLLCAMVLFYRRNLHNGCDNNL